MGKIDGWVPKQVVRALSLVAVALVAPSAALACGGPPLVLPSGEMMLAFAIVWITAPIFTVLAALSLLSWLLS